MKVNLRKDYVQSSGGFVEDSSMTSFMQKTFSWMAMGLFMTFLVAFISSTSEKFMYYVASNQIIFFALIIAEFGLVISLSRGISKMSINKAMNMFFIYAVLNGITLSFVFLIYTGASIAMTFLIAAAMFGGMALYGYTTKKDLSSMGSLAIMALLGLIVASIVNIFLKSTPLYWLISVVGILVFVGLTAFDVQRIKGIATQVGGDEKYAIFGALMLYLDFINLFLYLLRFFGRRD